MGRRKTNPKKSVDLDDFTKNKKSDKRAIPSTICKNHYFTDGEVKLFQNRLLEWYDSDHRDLPWRTIAKSETNPNLKGYAVWVSEIMLQQTQVATVIPYFNTWMKKWPNVQALAEASLEDVLQVWAGLGYYSRGRRLHEGAKIIVSQLQGHIPNTVEELVKSIPGIGTYSASAIASIAYQRPVGVVDGNVIRVLSRFRTIGANTAQSIVRDHLWELAHKLVSKERPGDFNQALMEFGAIICTPQNPNCIKCPVSTDCRALALAKSVSGQGKLESYLKDSVNKKTASPPKIKKSEITDIEDAARCTFCIDAKVWQKNSQVTAFPCKVEKKAARQEKVYVLVIEKNGKLLMVKRPEKGLLAGLWEFPCVILTDDNSPFKAAQSLADKWKVSKEMFSSRKSVGEVIHLFSHIHTTYVIESLCLTESKSSHKTEEKDNCVWFSPEEIKNAAVSTAMKKVLALVKKNEENTSKEPASKKRKHSPPDCSKQKSIKSFFS